MMRHPHKRKKKRVPLSGTCTYVIAWRGPCGKSCKVDRCKEHENKVCGSCGAPATQQCSTTMGPCVCGEDICDNCEHMLAPDGTSRWMKHCKKGEQKYKIWFMQDETEKAEGRAAVVIDSIKVLSAYAERNNSKAVREIVESNTAEIILFAAESELNKTAANKVWAEMMPTTPFPTA